MTTLDPLHTSLPRLYNLLQGTIGPRPIALASTVDHLGNINLSPFSFFNIFSLNPPVVVFSPARRGRDKTTKHTYENVLEVPEVVINLVDYNMVHQTSLSSVEYLQGVNEFVKSGLTPVPSVKIKPPRVAESPVSLECSVRQVLPLGDDGGAGNLVICEILLVHYNELLLDDKGHIDPHKLDIVGRMGNDYYCRASGEAIFKVPKPGSRDSIGFDQIPESIRTSDILTGNDLGHLGSIEKFPDEFSINEYQLHPEVAKARVAGKSAIHALAKKLLKEDRIEEAWKVLLGNL